jgi:hypothetical protein
LKCFKELFCNVIASSGVNTFMIRLAYSAMIMR